MGEYYGVVRTPSYLSHALERGSGAVAVYKNHKYLARAMTTSGKYRYFYNTLELTAYKQQRTNQTNSPTNSSSSQSKSLRERWEERRGMLGAAGSGGSGGSGGGGGRSGSGSSGGSGRGSKKLKVINRVKPQEGPKSYGHLSAGALKNQGENTPDNEPTKTKKKKKKTTNRRPMIRSTVGVPISSTSMRYYRR